VGQIEELNGPYFAHPWATR